MNNLNNRKTIEKNANQMAAAECTFSTLSVLEEIQPLLREYLIGNFEIIEKAIILAFKNGQQFRLTVEEM